MVGNILLFFIPFGIFLVQDHNTQTAVLNLISQFGLCALFTFGLGWSVVTLYEELDYLIRGKLSINSFIKLLTVLIVFALLGIFTINKIKQFEKESQKNEFSYQVGNSNSPDELSKLYKEVKANPNFMSSNLVFHFLQNPKTPADIIEDIYRQAQSSPANKMSIYTYVLSNPNTDPRIVFEIYQEATSSNNKKIIYSILARGVATPQSLLRILAEDPNNADFISNLLRNSNLPLDLIQKYANSQDQKLRMYIAMNPSLPLSIFQQYANSPNPKDRLAIVDNAKLPLGILNKLLQDPDLEVRQAAINRKRYLSIIEKLAN